MSGSVYPFAVSATRPIINSRMLFVANIKDPFRPREIYVVTLLSTPFTRISLLQILLVPPPVSATLTPPYISFCTSSHGSHFMSNAQWPSRST